MSTNFATDALPSPTIAVALQAWNWALQFFQRMVTDLEFSIQDEPLLSPVQQLALRRVALAYASSHDARARAVAAELFGELPPLTPEVVAILLQLAADLDVDVRVQAIASLGAASEFPNAVLPVLIKGLTDPELAIQQAAIWSLQDLRDKAQPAIESIRAVIADSQSLIRQLAIAALPWIAADRSLTNLYLQSLMDDDVSVRIAAASSLGISRSDESDVCDSLAARLQDADNDVAFFCVWSLGRYDLAAEPHAAAVLERLGQMPWTSVLEAGQYPTRPDLRSTLKRMLAPIGEDPLLDDFRLEFLAYAFHPATPGHSDFVARLARHRWYRKLQVRYLRRQYGLTRSRADQQRVEELFQTASSLFVEKLLQQPRLGMVSTRYRELPGYIRNHAHKIAWRVRRIEPTWYGVEDSMTAKLVVPGSDTQLSTQDAVLSVQRFLATELEPDVAAVLEQRLMMGRSIPETAAALGLTESQVKTRHQHGLAAVRQHFRHLLD